MNVKSYIADLYIRFQSDEEGLALTEYLILLGLLAGAVVGAVIIFGGNLDTAWRGWAAFIGLLDNAPSSLPSS